MGLSSILDRRKVALSHLENGQAVPMIFVRSRADAWKELRQLPRGNARIEFNRYVFRAKKCIELLGGRVLWVGGDVLDARPDPQSIMLTGVVNWRSDRWRAEQTWVFSEGHATSERQLDLDLIARPFPLHRVEAARFLLRLVEVGRGRGINAEFLLPTERVELQAREDVMSMKITSAGIRPRAILEVRWDVPSCWHI